MDTKLDVVIIGGGQAGLVMGYYLKQLSRRFVILDAGETVGDSWRSRYDSLRLFTPAPFNGLTGMPFPGKKDYFPTKDEVADYLQAYVKHFDLPVILEQRVEEVNKVADLYLVHTTDTTWQAEQVVICTGAFHTPFIPAFSKNISSHIRQLHSSVYQNPGQLLPGETLVVGGGNSGFQIAEELVSQGKEVYFSFRGKLKSGPTSAWFFAFLFRTGILAASKYSWFGSWLQQQGEVIMSPNLRQVLSSPDLHQVGAALGADKNGITCEKAYLQDVANIIWATGYTSDFSWVKLPVFDKTGQPVQQRGVTSSPGLYFLGLPWLHSRGSGLLGGVSKDAAYLAHCVKAYQKKVQQVGAGLLNSW